MIKVGSADSSEIMYIVEASTQNPALSKLYFRKKHGSPAYLIFTLLKKKHFKETALIAALFMKNGKK